MVGGFSMPARQGLAEEVEVLALLEGLTWAATLGHPSRG